jgi:hypothetical protein
MPSVLEEEEVLSSCCIKALHAAAEIAGDTVHDVTERLLAIKIILDYALEFEMPGIAAEEEPSEEEVTEA